MSVGVEASVASGPGTLAAALKATIGSASGRQPVRLGVPFAKGALNGAPQLAWIESSDGERSVAQVAPLALWSDGSIQWLRVDAIIDVDEGGATQWQLAVEPVGVGARASTSPLAGERPLVDCGPVCIAAEDRVDGQRRPNVVALSEKLWQLEDSHGRVHAPVFEAAVHDAHGPVRHAFTQTGHFPRLGGLRIEARWNIYPAMGVVRCDVTLHNPRRARHRGGLWDLGDAGSILFKDFSLNLPMEDAHGERLSARVEPSSPSLAACRQITIVQGSSGGENWQSRAHVNRHGDVPCPFRGYRTEFDDRSESGLRALPQATIHGKTWSVTLAAPEFWQQFPKVLQSRPGALRFGLFPAEYGDSFELQGGERKRHTFWLQFTASGIACENLTWVFDPMVLTPSADACVAAGVVAEMRPQPSDARENLDVLAREALDGPRSIPVNRERVDEYGWRNFGDMHADHEAVYYAGEAPFVSHYNNQFDVVLGLQLQFLRTDDRRWFRLADELARHVMDVDVYHTEDDKAAYNGGLFWFTDHYLTAHESTHRTYSRKNAPPAGSYGGGPGAEHNYTTGLLLYHFQTGCPHARVVVVELADWVANMEDGRRTILGIVDDGCTGLATLGYDKPGRGGANSINALVDAWTLTKDAKYLILCEQLIRRCIHPADEVEKMELLDAEKNWSYTMFLTSLAKYADAKAEAGQRDACYDLATSSLLRFAEWMAAHERPYFDQSHRLEYPTEAWAAQEFRKANVLRRAARYAPPALAARLLARGNELGDRAWLDLMRFEDTRATIRSLALVMTEGLADCVFRHAIESSVHQGSTLREFPPREPFVSQKRRVLAMVKRPWGAARVGARLLDPRRWRRWRRSRYAIRETQPSPATLG